MQTFLVSGCGEVDTRWLESTLGDQGRLVPVGHKLEAILGLVDQMTVGIVFMCVGQQNRSEALSVIEGLNESRPQVAVVAIGESADSELVLGAMRAGAKDFLTVGQRGSDVQSLIRRLGRRPPSVNSVYDSQRGRMVVMYGVDATPDSSLIASHMALQLAQKQGAVLFIDLAPGLGEVEALLSLKCTFGVEDAMQAAHRLDSSVISSAFATYGSSLHVLPLLQDARYPEGYSYAEAILLLGVLRQQFPWVVVNACGQADSGFVRALVSSADQLLWYLTQSVSSSRRNLHQLQRFRAAGVLSNDTGLLLDRYLPRVAPEHGVLATMFDWPVVAKLPVQHQQRLNSLNQGVPLFKLAPKDELTKALLELANAVLPKPPAADKGKGLLTRWLR